MTLRRILLFGLRGDLALDDVGEQRAQLLVARARVGAAELNHLRGEVAVRGTFATTRIVGRFGNLTTLPAAA